MARKRRPPVRVTTEVTPEAQARGRRRLRRAVTPPRGGEQLPLPGAQFAPPCVRTPSVGRGHHLRPANPYKVCLTPRLMRELWGPEYHRYNPRKLGCGVFACAWTRKANFSPQINPDRLPMVVKITNDSQDVAALQKATAAGLDHVPYLFRAVRIRSRTTSRHPVFGLVVERVRGRKELPPGVTEHVGCIRHHTVRSRRTDPAVVRASCCYNVPKRQMKYCTSMAKQMPSVIRQLHRLGISTQDLHSDNIGLGVGGKWKVLDLGLSGLSSPEAPVPEMRGASHSRKRRSMR